MQGPNNNVGGGRDGTGSTGWGNNTDNDGYYGGGGGSQGGGGYAMDGAKGAVRIIWGKNTAGLARTFPNPETAGGLYDPYTYQSTNSYYNTTHDYVGVTTNGFAVKGGSSTQVNENGSRFIYLAIA